MSYVSHLECAKCGATYEADRPQNLCRCGGPLLVRYDLERIRRQVDKKSFAARRRGLWRFRELLPLADERNIVTLGEGDTPVLETARLHKELGLAHLYIKDEGLNPTGTFKARGAAVGVSRAKELGIRTVAMPTAGNAGGAWAAYSAKAGIDLVVAMPQDAPDIAKKESFQYGAKTYLVKGLISDAGKIIAAGVREHGWFDAATLKEPYRIEGKKTMGLELAEYFGWEFPDAILYPTGGGVGIIGIYKAYLELAALGWVPPKMPKLISVQAEGCNPIVRAFEQQQPESRFCEGAHTIAGGIRVPKALGDFLVLRAIRESGGTAVQVTDEEIRRAMEREARTEGLFPSPEGAALVAALPGLVRSGFLKPQEKVVLLNTGAGIKYPSLVTENLPVIEKDASI